MMLKKLSLSFLTLALAAFAAGAADKPAFPETVTVGNPANAADSTGYGAVAYEYKIGKYEVTNTEYCEFLNGVAKTDTHELYDGRMDGGPEDWGGITRSGDSGSYTYTVRAGMGNKPVGYVTWYSAVRFANWLTNGKGSGDTEKGTYTFDGDNVKAPDHAALAAGKVVTWVMSSENEWYKAAYYDASKTGYWPYPCKSNDAPQANLNTNSPTDVGAQKVASAYGTFDQGGNAWEWNETQNNGKVGLRGGSFYINDHAGYMHSNTRYEVLSAKWPHYGFRVVSLGKAEAK